MMLTSLYFENTGNLSKTRMHCSRMRTAHSLTVSRSIWGWACVAGGMHGGGGHAWQGGGGGACVAGGSVRDGGNAWHAYRPVDRILDTRL